MKNKVSKTSSATVALLGLLMAGCGAGDSVSVGNDVPVAFVQRSDSINMNPTDGAPTAGGGDLIVMEQSAPDAPRYNVTQGYTKGTGDVSDPEPSYDGKKIVFAMRCPPANTGNVSSGPRCTGHWNIWEYDTGSGGLGGGKLKQITSSNEHDDVDPAYLPAGAGFVFSSNRQTTSKKLQGKDVPGAPQDDYYALDEYERERVFNLHTMEADGSKITQISVNQSHDRNPVVLSDGQIMFSRWDHVSGRNHFKIFTVKPDGADMFVMYGAHSSGNSFLHPREMQPGSGFDGHLTSDLMPLSRTNEGGGLVIVNAKDFSEEDTPKHPGVGGKGQSQMTQPLEIGGDLSRLGRITTPYPLWDGTNRVLIAYTPCMLTENGVAKLCANFTDTQQAEAGDRNRPVAEANAASIRNNARPAYAIWMLDAVSKIMRPVAVPPLGTIYTDPIALQRRDEPKPYSSALDATMGDFGILEVRSVYDTDGLGRMGDAVLKAADFPAGCATKGITTIPSTDPQDLRANVADLVSMKDPTKEAYRCAPGRFIRVTRAVAPRQSTMGLRSVIGETEFEPQMILGYVPIEPDGSVHMKVPADTPIALAVIDSKGRAFQTHTNWIQVRPGEKRTCNGCHSPRSGGALNSVSIINNMPAGLLASMVDAPLKDNETMAIRRGGINGTAPAPNMDFTDVWADTSVSGVVARDPILLKYTGNTIATDDVPVAPANGLINYPEHIQKLWEATRAGGTCISCHADATKLDLRNTLAGTGRVISYEELLIGDVKIDAGTGLPSFHLEEGIPVVDREPALVDNMASEGDAIGLARKSRLIEILFGDDLFASAASRTLYPTPHTATPVGPDHRAMLTPPEKRLLAEWVDLGGQYYNNTNGVTSVAKLTQASFESVAYPIIQSTCAAGCHQAIGSANTAAATSFRDNRYVLTGSPEGDFNVTLSMINDACTPANSYLLRRPSTVPHPAGASASAPAVLRDGNYNTLAAWVQGGC